MEVVDISSLLVCYVWTLEFGVVNIVPDVVEV